MTSCCRGRTPTSEPTTFVLARLAYWLDSLSWSEDGVITCPFTSEVVARSSEPCGSCDRTCERIPGFYLRTKYRRGATGRYAARQFSETGSAARGAALFGLADISHHSHQLHQSHCFSLNRLAVSASFCSAAGAPL